MKRLLKIAKGRRSREEAGDDYFEANDNHFNVDDSFLEMDENCLAVSNDRAAGDDPDLDDPDDLDEGPDEWDDEWESGRTEPHYVGILSSAISDLEALPAQGFVSAFILWLDLLAIKNFGFVDGPNSGWALWYQAHEWLIGLCLLVGIAGLFRGWIFRHQVFSSVLGVVFTFVSWIYAPSLLMLATAAHFNAADELFDFTLPADVLFIYLSAFYALWIAAAMATFAVSLRKRLRARDSRGRRIKEGPSAAGFLASMNFWLFFVLAVVVGNVVTLGTCLFTTGWMLIALALGTLLANTVVERTYLAHMKALDRKHWDRPILYRTFTSEEVEAWIGKTAKCLLKVVLVLVAFVAVLVFLPMIAEWIAWHFFGFAPTR